MDTSVDTLLTVLSLTVTAFGFCLETGAIQVEAGRLRLLLNLGMLDLYLLQVEITGMRSHIQLIE